MHIQHASAASIVLALDELGRQVLGGAVGAARRAPYLRLASLLAGVEFEVGGPLRVEHRRDGWYVVDNGMLIPVASADEGCEIMREMSKK